MHPTRLGYCCGQQGSREGRGALRSQLAGAEVGHQLPAQSLSSKSQLSSGVQPANARRGAGEQEGGNCHGQAGMRHGWHEPRVNPPFHADQAKYSRSEKVKTQKLSQKGLSPLAPPIGSQSAERSQKRVVCSDQGKSQGGRSTHPRRTPPPSRCRAPRTTAAWERVCLRPGWHQRRWRWRCQRRREARGLGARRGGQRLSSTGPATPGYLERSLVAHCRKHGAWSVASSSACGRRRDPASLEQLCPAFQA